MAENIHQQIEKITAQTEHRSEPLPNFPWIMCQTWENLLFIHWPIEIERLRPLVPAKIEIDTYDGQAWLAQLPMHMVNLHLRDLPPLSGTGTFPEINLRTYVRVNDQPGVFFFSIDAQTHFGSWVARHMFQLPYRYAEMEFAQQDDGFHMKSHRQASDGVPAADFVGRYRPIGKLALTKTGSLEQFLVERYNAFAQDAQGNLYQGHIHHLPWEIQAAEATIETNTVPQAAGIELPDTDSMVHYSPGTQSILWPVVPIAL